VALEDFKPTPSDVALHMRARLVDGNGNRLDSFTEDTTPTLKEIEEAIPKRAGRITSKIGTEICEGEDPAKRAALYADAKDLWALAVAIVAERSYYPEQVGSGRSPYDEMVAEFESGAKTLVEAVAEHCGGGGGEDGPGASTGGSGALPRSSFPCARDWAEALW
jgi:hypothetical protein